MSTKKLHTKAKRLLAEHVRLMRRVNDIRRQLKFIDLQLFGTNK